MIKNKDFIIFSDDWGRHPFSCQHIMEHFLPHNRLLWVNTIGMRTPEFTLYDMKRAFGKIASWLSPAKAKGEKVTLHPHLRIISPFMIPYNKYDSVRAFNVNNVVKKVLQAAEEWNFTDPILLATQPLAADYVGKLGEKLVAYYCVDDFIYWPGMNQPQLVKGMEESLVAQADLIFAVSDSLCASRCNTKGETKLLTHGVDVAHFAKACVKPHVQQNYPQGFPEKLKNTSHPIIGFYGLIDKRFDIDLVELILQQQAQWQILCIGTTCIDLSRLQKYNNFHWIDAVAYDVLPNYAAYFDVAFIPYEVNEHTHTINPLKLREYMAMGKAIVATPMREAMRFEKSIHIAAKGLPFVKAVESALQNPLPPHAYTQDLQGESWADKAELVSAWLEETAQSKKKS